MNENEKGMSRRMLMLAAVLMTALTSLTAQTTTLRQQMERLRQDHGVSFVYDATINVDRPYTGKPVGGMRLGAALRTLFRNSGISCRQQGRYVLLKSSTSQSGGMAPAARQEQHGTPVRPATPRPRQRHFTLSGYVKDSNGDPLINATVYDLTTRQGTMTNAYGFFSLTLAEGRHEIRCSYIGFDTLVEPLQLTANRHQDFSLKENASLGEVVVTTDLNSPLLKTQTGKLSLSAHDINTEYSLLSSPDVVKTIQRTSGVAEGVELASGLYVHGGNNDENLFLIDGTPLYQTNHTLGLFSSFNTDMVKNVDFYKSGFPARYGGRLSSVIDVRTADGDFYHAHGSYRIGLLDGSVHLEGPIRRGKTSYNIGIRRSWIDLLSRPTFAIVNHGRHDGDRISLAYFFHDMNAKLTNIFNDRSRLTLSLYSGEDRLNGKSEEDYSGSSYEDHDVQREKFHWGNFNAALDWNIQLTPRLFANFTAVYTHNRSSLWSVDDWRYGNRTGRIDNVSHTEHGYKSSIDDIGYRAAFDFRPAPHHHIRFGQDYTYHHFRPQTYRQNNYYGSSSDERTDTVMSHSHNRDVAHQLTLYAEDELTVDNHWSLNGGLSWDLFRISGKSFSTVSPRMAVKFQPSPRLSFKASYTLMSQFVHKISNSFLDLPTDYWVPTTARLSPMRSWQLAAGVYMRPGSRWLLSLEGYYKHSSHLLQYASWTGLEPPAANWDLTVMEGEGRFYGLELDADYHTARLSLHGSYTLSWNERKFADFFPSWYYDKFDNRHKLFLSARWAISRKVAAYAAWTFHTGNRMTVPTQYFSLPAVPTPDAGGSFTAPSAAELNLAYEQPNNVVLPAYHRLDVGLDFHHTTKHGHERIWNVSLYNLYCHLNSLWVRVKVRDNRRISVSNHAFIPVIPSFSYTIKF
ncbi:MAG: TonB-dependent receptor [Prevotella sp.]|nr:TonB-dependent receptor [Prevotella sp.]